MDTPDNEQNLNTNAESPFPKNIFPQIEEEKEEEPWDMDAETASSYAELDDLQRLILHHTQEYPQWLEKMQDWTMAQLLQRLRSIDIHTSKLQFEEYAQEAKAAFQVSNILLTKAQNSAKAIDKLSMLWAAVELLWHKMLPDWLNVEEMLKKAAKLATLEQNSLAVLDSFVALFEAFLEELCQDETPLNYDTIAEWCTLNAAWLDDVMAYWLEAIVRHFDALQKLHLPTAKMVDTLQENIPDLATKSTNFAQIRLYLALINGSDKAVEAIIQEMEEVFEPGKAFYEFLGDFYTKPPVYAFTAADTVLAMKYYSKMMDKLDVEV